MSLSSPSSIPWPRQRLPSHPTTTLSTVDNQPSNCLLMTVGSRCAANLAAKTGAQRIFISHALQDEIHQQFRRRQAIDPLAPGQNENVYLVARLLVLGEQDICRRRLAGDLLTGRAMKHIGNLVPAGSCT